MTTKPGALSISIFPRRSFHPPGALNRELGKTILCGEDESHSTDRTSNILICLANAAVCATPLHHLLSRGNSMIGRALIALLASLETGSCSLFQGLSLETGYRSLFQGLLICRATLR